MIKKILKTLFKSGKTATESVGKSMDFIDDVLEKEYITGAVENVKESTGKIVQKAGMVYQKTKDSIEDNINMENIKEQVDKVVEKGKEAKSDLAESMLDTSETLKNVMKEGEDIVRKITGEEE